MFTISLKFVFAQYETNPNIYRTSKWYFGDSLAIKITSDSIYNLENYKDWTYEGTSILLDQNGELQYYSNGVRLYDSVHRLLFSNLKGGRSSCQQIIMNPIDTLIFIFTAAPKLGVGSDGFHFSLFNTISNTFYFTNKMLLKRVGEKQSSLFHQNVNDIWNIAHSQEGDTFYFFIIQKSKGLLCCPVQQQIGSFYPNYNPSQGVLKFSSNGSHCANANWNLNNVDLFKFDNESGLLYENINIPVYYPYGLEFSSSNYIYVTDRGKNLVRFNISFYNKNAILSSVDTVGKQIHEKYGQIQIDLYNNMFVSNYKDSFLSLIKNTNSALVSFVQSGHTLNGTCEGGLPNFNASYFYTPSIDFAYTEDCWDHAYLFEGRDTIDADGYKWIFQKSGYKDSVLTKHCNYQFQDTGKWQVCHIAWNTSRSDTVTKTLTLRPKWQQDVLGRDTFYCSGDTQFQLTLKAPSNMHCIHWNGEEPILDEDLGPIVDYNHFHVDSLLVDTAGLYSVKLTNKTFCQIRDTILIEEKTKPAKPLISFNTGELASTVVADRYNWYLNDTFFLSTSEKSIIPSKSGTYQLVLTSEFGCKSDKSDSFFLSLGVAERSELNQSFLIYPNPSDGVFNLKTDLIDFEVEIYDATGRKIYDQRSVNTFRLEIPGNYLVILKSEKMRSSRVITVK